MSRELSPRQDCAFPKPERRMKEKKSKRGRSKMESLKSIERDCKELSDTIAYLRDGKRCAWTGHGECKGPICCHHVVFQSHSNALRYDPVNKFPLCAGAHLNQQYHNDIFMLFFTAAHPDRAAYLESHRRDFFKMNRCNLEKLRDELRQQVAIFGGLKICAEENK